MKMNRRDALHAGLFASLAAVLPRNAAAQSSFAPRPDNWRSFEITTRLDLEKAQCCGEEGSELFFKVLAVRATVL